MRADRVQFTKLIVIPEERYGYSGWSWFVVAIDLQGKTFLSGHSGFSFSQERAQKRGRKAHQAFAVYVREVGKRQVHRETLTLRETRNWDEPYELLK